MTFENSATVIQRGSGTLTEGIQKEEDMKKLAALGLSLMLCLFALAGCGSSDSTSSSTDASDELTGTWTSSEEADSKTTDMTLAFEDGGSFTLNVKETADGETSTADSEGTYTVDDGKITFIVEEVKASDKAESSTDDSSSSSSSETEVQDQLTFTCDYTIDGSTLTLTEDTGSDNDDISVTGLDLTSSVAFDKEES